MRKITNADLVNITGIPIEGYIVESARVKNGSCSDSDHYGIILAGNPRNEYVTWQFHFREDESISVYWGHYMTDHEAAVRDFNTRDIALSLRKFTVTITETLKAPVTVEAVDSQQAIKMVSDAWCNNKHILSLENFAAVAFSVELATDISNDGL